MKKFEPTFESLREFKCPKWFKDAKFGIWSHWGPQSVPMYGDWYARKMYIEGSDCYKYHLRHYGHPSEFGYKDICALWKAEKFDPDALMDLYVRAGARYFVTQAMHHDNFFNYDSKVNKFNSMNIGPKRDICMEWKKAAKKYGLPFGVTEHLATSFSWTAVNKGADKYGPYAGVPYDGNDPDCPFYYNNQEHYIEDPQEYIVAPWYTPNKEFHRYWLDAMKEVIDRFEPDLLYSDGTLPFHIYYGNTTSDPATAYEAGLEAVSYLYNKSIENYGENRAIYTQKECEKEIYSIGILDVEKSQLTDIASDPWQTDTCIGNWFYDVRQDYKRPGHIIEMLVDIISKNGTMLLNILQRPDGSIDKEAVYILEELEKWFKICAEAVYETEPWRVAAEGDSAVVVKNRFQEDRVQWTSSDFRFVKKDNFVYAYMMAVDENRTSVIKSFNESEKIKSVTLLGYGKVEFSQAFGILTVKLPEEMPTNYTNCLKIEL